MRAEGKGRKGMEVFGRGENEWKFVEGEERNGSLWEGRKGMKG